MVKIYVRIAYAKSKKAGGYILDISRGGMCIASISKVPKNSRIIIMSKSDILCALKGKVVHVEKINNKKYGYKLGIKLLLLNKDNRRYLEQFISAHILEKRKVPRLSFAY